MNTVLKSPLLASFLSHQNDLLRFLSFKIGCADTAEDLCQETFLRIANYTEAETIENPRAFCFHVANNLALDHLRKRTFRDKFKDEKSVSETTNIPIDEPEVAVHALQQLERLERLIEDLPAIRQQVFLLSRVEGKSYKFIAKELGISVRTVENHVFKALKTLKTRYDRHE